MAGGSARGRWERVLQARAQSRRVLGQTDQPELFDAPPAKRKSAKPAPSPAPSHTEKPEYVLTLGEAATRLGVSRDELDRMISAGKIEVLETAFTRTVRAADVERLTAHRP